MDQITTPTPNPKPLPWAGVKPSINRDDDSRLSLVLLRDLVRWLMQAKGVTFMDASRELSEALQTRSDLRLYVTTESGAARAVGAADTFGLTDRPSGRRILSAGLDAIPASKPAIRPLPAGVTPGLSAALFYVGKVWGNGGNPESILDDANNAASRLAMPCEQAAAIWGHGQPVQSNQDATPSTYAELVAARKGQSGAPWTDSMVSLMATEIDARHGQKGVRKGIAGDLGVKVQRISQLLKATRKRQPASTGIAIKKVVHINGKTR